MQGVIRYFVALLILILPNSVNAAAISKPNAYLHVASIYEGRLFIKLLNARADTYIGQSDYRSGAYALSAGGLEFIRPFEVKAISNGTIKGRSASPIFYRQSSGRKSRAVDYRRLPPSSVGDPIAQLLRLSLAGPTPCIGAMTVFDGEQKYRITFTRQRPAALAKSLNGQGLTTPQACALGFSPISGFGGAKASSKGALRGNSSATFAWSSKARLWILTDIEVGTVVGPAHISLTHLSISSTNALP